MADLGQLYDGAISDVYTAGGAEGYTAGTLNSWLGRRRSTTTAEARAETPAQYGETEWVFIRAGGAIAANELVQRNISTSAIAEVGWDGTVQGLLGHRSGVLGKADHALASGEYGWIKRRGMVEVINDAGAQTAAGDPMMASASVAGAVDIGTSGTNDYAHIGVFLDVIAASGTGTAYLDLP